MIDFVEYYWRLVMSGKLPLGRVPEKYREQVRSRIEGGNE